MATAHANTAIETETAHLGKQGAYAFSQSYEYARSKDGKSGGTAEKPFAVSRHHLQTKAA